MSMIPSDLTAHVGQEVSLRQVFQAAWRSQRRHFWKGLLGLFVVLLVMGAILATGSGLSIGGVAAGRFDWTVLSIVLIIAGSVVMYLVPAFVYTPLGGGLLWSMSRTFDGQPLSLRGLFDGFRRRYLRLMVLGLLEFATMAVACAAPVALLVLLITGSPLNGGGFAVWIVVLPLVYLAIPLAFLTAHAFFYLSPLFAMADEKAGAWTCLRYNLRIVRSRPKQFAKVFLFPLLGWVPLFIGTLVLWGTVMFMAVIPTGATFSSAETPKTNVLFWLAVGGGALLLIAFGLWWGLLTGMLKAAFFRAAYGYSLDQPLVALAPAEPATFPATSGLTGSPAAEVPAAAPENPAGESS